MKKGSFEEFFIDSEIAQNYEDRKEKIEKGGLLMKVFNEGSFLEDKPLWLKDLFGKINSFCLNEIRKGITVVFLETYTRYNFNNLMFCKIKSTSEALKIYLKLRYSELESPPKWIRDYYKVSRQTWIEGTIREEDLIEETIVLDILYELIKKSFNRVIRHPKLSKFPVEKPVKILPNFVTPTKFTLNLHVSTDGFVEVGLKVHKSQLPKIIEKLIE